MQNYRLYSALSVISILSLGVAILILLSKRLGNEYISMYMMGGSDGDLIVGLIAVSIILTGATTLSIWTDQTGNEIL